MDRSGTFAGRSHRTRRERRGSASTAFCALVVLTLGIALCGRWEPVASANDAAGTTLAFPADTPGWLVAATKQAARGLGDSDATLAEMRLGRFPIVVIHGAFRCGSCPTPSGAAVPTGHYASLTFNAVTHRLHDLALSPRAPGKLTALCSGDCAGRRRVVLASAQEALDAAGASVILGDRTGSHRCLLSTRATTSGFVAATCKLAIAFGKQQTSLTFTETWTGLDSSGRRYAPDSPTLDHFWRVTETPAGWVTKLSSTGNAPPK